MAGQARMLAQAPTAGEAAGQTASVRCQSNAELRGWLTRIRLSGSLRTFAGVGDQTARPRHGPRFGGLRLVSPKAGAVVEEPRQRITVDARWVEGIRRPASTVESAAPAGLCAEQPRGQDVR